MLFIHELHDHRTFSTDLRTVNSDKISFVALSVIKQLLAAAVPLYSYILVIQDPFSSQHS